MKPRTDSGFSLIELMVVLIVLLIIVGSIFSSMVNAQKSFDAEQANAEANANARFAVNRIKEILESSGNNPGQIANINDQTGGILNLYSALGSTPYTAGSSGGLSGTTVSLTGTSNCSPAVANTYCGIAVQLLSDLNGDRDTGDDIPTTNPTGAQIFSQNIITSENIQLYLDNTPTSNGLREDTIYLVNFNDANRARQAIAEFIVDLRFVVDIANSSVTVTITARSNRAIAVENVIERRFRYATLTSVIRIRNMNNNVAQVIDSLRTPKA